MKEILILTAVTVVTFLIFGLTLLIGILKKNKSLKRTALFAFICFVCISGVTGYRFVTKSYKKVTAMIKARNGDEIYDALFDKRQFDCVKVLQYQDQVVPRIDYAIWLNFETCPNELKRILSRHKFSCERVSTKDWNGQIPFRETLEWFNPAILGDSIVVCEYSSSDQRNIQTIWTSLDSTKVFCRDIFD